MDTTKDDMRATILNAIHIAPHSDMTLSFQCLSTTRAMFEEVLQEPDIQQSLEDKSLEVQFVEVDREQMNGTIGLNTLTLALVFASSLIKKESFSEVRNILMELIIQAEYMLRTEPAEAHKILDSYRPLKITTADLILAGLRDKFDMV